MTQDEIINMALQAGIRKTVVDFHKDEIVRLFGLAVTFGAAKEREACIHACKEIYSAWVCESDDDVDYPNPNDCIRAIKARGEA